MPEPEKQNGDEAAKDIGFSLFKELTFAMMENARVTRALVQHIGGVPGENGFAGLMENVMELNETVVELADRMTGLILKVSMVDHVLDKLGDIKDREPNWRDAIAAKLEFDKKIEEELIQADKDAEQEEKGEYKSHREPEKKPTKKPPMVENSKPSHQKKSHPPPVAPPKPA